MRSTLTHLIGLAAALLVPTWLLAQPASQPADVRFAALPATNTVFSPVSYADLPSWQTRRDWLREQVRIAAGLVPEPRRTMLDAQVFGKLVRDGYTIEKAYFTSSPGIYVTGNLYRPLNAQGRCPGIACPHGHWKNGRLHHDETGSIPARCITLARAGAVVFAYDMVGYNDSAQSFQHGEPALDTAETTLWGIGHLPLQTFNSIRVIDFLQSLPDVDPKRIGVTGASGGGTQTFILSAVDGRITADCPVNMISSTMQGGCICENAPGLRIDTNNMEIAALFAPHPRLMVSATGDWTKLTPQVEFPFARSIYALYDAADRIENVHVDAQHNYNKQSREAMYAFFGKRLLGRSDIHEADIAVEKPEDMLVFADRARLPRDWPTAQEIIRRKQSEVREQLEAYRPTSPARLQSLTALTGNVLRHMIDCDSTLPKVPRTRLIKPQSPQQVETLLQRHGRLVRTTSFLSAEACREGRWVLIVDPDGLAAAERYARTVDALLAAKRCVVFAEPLGTGGNRRATASTSSQPTRQGGFFTTFNRTDTSETVFDITTVVAAMAEGMLALTPDAIRHIDLIGVGRMGPACLTARAMLPQLTHASLGLVAEMSGFDTSRDAAYVDALFIPCIQRIGGLPALAAVAATGPMWLHNTGNKLDTTWLDAARNITRATVRVDAEPAGIDAIATWLTR